MDTLFCTGVYKDGYGVISKSVMRNKKISVEAKALYAYICSYAGAGGKAFPSLSKICEELGMSEKRLYKYRKELVDNNLIIVSKERMGSKYSNNIYFIVNEPVVNSNKKDNIEPSNNECVQNEPSQNERVENEPSQNGHVHNEPCRNVGTISNTPISNNNIKKEKKKKEKRKASTEFDELISNYSKDEKLCNAIYEFIKHRKAIKATMTTLALKKILSKLDAFTENDNVKIEILNQSIMNGWRGIFPLKGDFNYGDDRVRTTKQNISESKKFSFNKQEWTGLTPEEERAAREAGML